jgi:hypothetical protein
MSGIERAEQRRGAPSPYVPLLLTLIAFTGLLGFQTVELVQSRSAIAQMRDAQEQAYAESNKLRQQLNRLAGRTAALAERGNANAKAIVQAFARQGVTFRPLK